MSLLPQHSRTIHIVGEYSSMLSCYLPSRHEVNWTYIRRSEDVQDVFWTFYVRSVYVLCLRGRCRIKLFCVKIQLNQGVYTQYSNVFTYVRNHRYKIIHMENQMKVICSLKFWTWRFLSFLSHSVSHPWSCFQEENIFFSIWRGVLVCTNVKSFYYHQKLSKL